VKRLFAVFFAAVAAVLFLDSSACLLYCRMVTRYFADASVVESDTAVVFFSDFLDDFSDMDDETYERLEHAEELYRRGTVGNIICTGGNGLKGKIGMSGAEMMTARLVERGVPRERVLRDSVSYDSFTSWEEVCRIMHERGWESAVLVSSPLHLYRLARELDRKSLSVSFSPYSFDCTGSLAEFYFLREKIHHEWLAFAARNVIPGNLYAWILRVVREK